MASLHSEEDCRWKQLLLAKDKKEKEKEEKEQEKEEEREEEEEGEVLNRRMFMRTGNGERKTM